MKPFLLLSIRAEEAAAVDEYDAFRRFTGLAAADLHRIRLHRGPLGEVSLADWSGILLGGGAFNASAPADLKSEVQRRVEKELFALLDEVVAADFAFLGACYGIGILGAHQGGTIDTSHPEPVGPLPVSVTAEGSEDALFAGVPSEFAAYGGHKEGLATLPDHAVRLASSSACPVQAFRVGRNVYATQFHPELDLAGICTRIEVYKHAGYFDPSQAALLQERARAVQVTEPGRLLRNFVALAAGQA